MKVPGKSGGPSLIISQKFTAHGHVLEDHESRDGRVVESSHSGWPGPSR